MQDYDVWLCHGYRICTGFSTCILPVQDHVPWRQFAATSQLDHLYYPALSRDFSVARSPLCSQHTIRTLFGEHQLSLLSRRYAIFNQYHLLWCCYQNNRHPKGRSGTLFTKCFFLFCITGIPSVSPSVLSLKLRSLAYSI